MIDPFFIALLNLVAKVGIDAAIAILESKAATIDDAIAALKRAKEKSLQAYIDEDAARRLVSPPVPGSP